MTRLVSWFSCGAASAVASKCALALSDSYEVQVICCDTRPSEHIDNYRFSIECEQWFGQPIIYLRNKDFRDVDEVFERTKYMAGIGGARCTTELKKIPRLLYAQPDDVHVFGLTADEAGRIERFRKRNPDLRLRFLLQEQGITKSACYHRIERAGIRLPAMYALGFDNNNCAGCVKASSPWYWDKVRQHFPEVFKRRCEQSRKLGVRLVEIHHHDRIFLDELPAGPFRKGRENLSCGPECGQQELKL